MKELNETIELMNSTDYKDRFRAEYEQLKIRKFKLEKMVRAAEAGTLEFTPTCPLSTYHMQLRAMSDYKAILEARAVMEHVDLEGEG